MSDECNLCGGSGVVSVGQKCICQYGPSSFAAPNVRQPDNLYLQWHGDSEPTDSPISEMDVTWSRDKIWPYDVEYARVPNDAFIAPLMRWLVQREGKCAATTMSILKRKLDRYIETANHDEWRKLPNDEKL